MNEEKEDWDFDFSQYGEEEEQEETIESLDKLKKPVVTGLRSRFSNGEAILAKLSNLENFISKYAIKVGARSQDISELWKFYSILDEYWDNIRHIYGSVINDDVNKIKKRCKSLLGEFENQNIPDKVHNNLLYLKSTLYRLAQLSNLRFEVDRTGRGIFSSAKRKIIQ